MTKKISVISTLAVIVLIVASLIYVRSHKYEFKAETESNLFTLAQVSASKGEFARAVQYYEKLLVKDPKHSIAMGMLAESYAKLNEADQAFKTLDKAIELAPSEQIYTTAINVAVQLKDDERLKKYRALIDEKKATP